MSSSAQRGACHFVINCINIRGLNTNFSAVQLHLMTEKPHVLVLTETQVRKNRDDTDFVVQNYRLENQFHSKRGVCMYIRKDVAYSRTRRHELNTKFFNSIAIKLSLAENCIFLLGIYRSPSCPSDDSTLDRFSKKIDDITSEFSHSDLTIVGDFNVHNTSWLKYSSRTDEAGRQAELLASAHGLTQLVSQPTRIPDVESHSGYLLDLLLSTLPNVTKVHVKAALGGSDHLLLSANIRTAKLPTEKTEPRKVWHLKSADWTSLREYYSSYTWDSKCFNSNRVDVVVDQFTKILTLGMNQHIPSAVVVPKFVKPWFTKNAEKACKDKKRAFSIFNRNKTMHNRREYISARNVCQNIIKREKAISIRRKAEKFANIPTGSKEFWQMAKTVRSNFTISSLPPLINENGIAVSGSLEKANLLAETFAANSRIPETHTNPPTIPKVSQRMNSIRFHEDIVLQYLTGINPNKASGPDGIPGIILKNCAAELAPILTRIFNLSLQSGVYPELWKSANITPVPKKGDHSDPNNYRPIAITSVAAKIFEKYINHHILTYLETTGIINDRQYGFRSKRSACDLLTFVTQRWMETMEQGGETYAVALDISKAFDRVWHANLLNKLDAYGIDVSIITWLKSFLLNRRFAVAIDGVSSFQFETNSGVPQGSALAPTLFLIYINDLLGTTSNPIHSFADDSTIHSSYTPPLARKKEYNRRSAQSGAINSLNSDLNKILEWGEVNRVTFNASKTQACEFSRLTAKNKNTSPIMMNECEIQQCSNIKVLGVNLSKDLLWNDHIMSIAKAANQKLGFLNRCKNYFTSSQLLQVYKSFIRPRLEYCSSVWGGASKTTLKLLDSVQRRAIRIIGDSSLTKDLDSLQHRRNVGDLTIFYKYYHGFCSTEIHQSMPSSAVPLRNTRATSMSHRHTVEMTTAKTSRYQKHFQYRVSKQWNSISNQNVFPNTKNVQSFKSNIHHFLKKNS